MLKDKKTTHKSENILERNLCALRVGS